MCAMYKIYFLFVSMNQTFECIWLFSSPFHLISPFVLPWQPPWPFISVVLLEDYEGIKESVVKASCQVQD